MRSTSFDPMDIAGFRQLFADVEDAARIHRLRLRDLLTRPGLRLGLRSLLLRRLNTVGKQHITQGIFGRFYFFDPGPVQSFIDLVTELLLIDVRGIQVIVLRCRLRTFGILLQCSVVLNYNIFVYNVPVFLRITGVVRILRIFVLAVRHRFLS